MQNQGAQFPHVESPELNPVTGRERRQRVLKKAIAYYADRAFTVECLVRDMSSGGVKLKLCQPLPLPDHFTLHVPMDGLTVDCVVRWRGGMLIGAKFCSEPVVDQNRVRQSVNPTGF